MRAFVTGSTGLLGSNLVRELVARGWQVTALVRDPHKAARQFEGIEGLTLIDGDLGEVAAFAGSLAGVDVVFHTAAYFREYFTDGDHEGLLQQLNVDAPVALAHAAVAHGVPRFVHVSSSGVLATRADGAASTEADVEDPQRLQNRYFASKVRADIALEAMRESSGLHLITVLPGWMFGPGDAAPTNAGRLVLDALQGRLPPVALPGRTAVVDARDVAAAMVTAAERGEAGERFIVAGVDTSLAQVMTAIAAQTGRAPPRFTLPYAAAWLFAAGSEVAGRVFGSEPIVTRMALLTLNSGHHIASSHAVARLGTTFRPLEETFADTVAWVRRELLEFAP